MAEPLHRVDLEACDGDGICGDVCPENVLTMVDEKAATVAERSDSCIECGQCVAVCPCEALEMPSLPATEFGELGRRLPFGYPEFVDFLELRRSVGAFKDRPVKRALIAGVRVI